MNKIIQEQLSKVSMVTLEFDSNTTKLFIPQTVKINNKALQKGKIYRIRFNNSMVNPNVNSTLAANWNAGKVPQHYEYYAEIVDKMANMIKINGVAVEDATDNFFGWAPDDAFEVISQE